MNYIYIYIFIVYYNSEIILKNDLPPIDKNMDQMLFLQKKLLSIDLLNLGFSISSTTRTKRDNELDGKDYHFLSVDNFKEKVQNNEFVEWEEVYKNVYYGTTKSEIVRLNKNDKNIVFDIDVVGGLNIKKQFPEKSISIFIKPPDLRELKNRLINRKTDSALSIETRLSKSESELTFSDKYDFVIVNDDLQEAIEETKKIIYQFITN